VARRNSKQRPLLAVESFVPQPYAKGSIFDVLARFGDVVFSRADFPAVAPELGGRVGWCPVLLSRLVVLQAKHGWDDRGTVARCGYDLRVKACLGLALDDSGPGQATLCRHRQAMQELGLDEVYLERLRRLLTSLELIEPDAPVLIDSVPLEGAGQQLDTYNLLAAGTQRCLREISQIDGEPLAAVAGRLGLSAYVGRSVKGRFEVNWDNEGSRRDFLEQLVADARTAQDALVKARQDGKTPEDDKGSGPGPTAPETTFPPEEPDASEQSSLRPDEESEPDERDPVAFIDSVIEHDVECDSGGKILGIRQRPAGDRPISATDPEMRHGRKSASQIIKGFKTQVVASVAFGFILLVRVFSANRHDGEELPEIVEDLEQSGFRPAWWGGDHAYGTLSNHRFFAERSAELVARMARPANGGRFTKDEFVYSFEEHTLTCPRGLTVLQSRFQDRDGQRGRLFDFTSVGCASCSLRDQCVSPQAKEEKGRTVFIVDDNERLIRDHLARREESQFKQRLDHRPSVERVISGFAQCGGKTARRFGRRNLAFDANLSALGYNLRRLGSLVAKDSVLEAKLRSAIGALAKWLRGLLQASCEHPDRRLSIPAAA